MPWTLDIEFAWSAEFVLLCSNDLPICTSIALSKIGAVAWILHEITNVGLEILLDEFNWNFKRVSKMNINNVDHIKYVFK